MYSSILKILLFSFVLCKTAEAAIELFKPEPKPTEFADQEGCFLASLQVVLKIGIPYSPPDNTSCERYVCNKKGVTQRFTCGAIEVPEGCEEIEGDKDLPYPRCCNIVRCTDEDGTDNDLYY